MNQLVDNNASKESNQRPGRNLDGDAALRQQVPPQDEQDAGDANDWDDDQQRNQVELLRGDGEVGATVAFALHPAAGLLKQLLFILLWFLGHLQSSPLDSPIFRQLSKTEISSHTASAKSKMPCTFARMLSARFCACFVVKSRSALISEKIIIRLK